MIVTAYECQALMGWAAILALRICEIAEEAESGEPISVETIVRSDKTDGLFDIQKGMSVETRKSVMLVLEAISTIKPDLVTKTTVDGVDHYAVA